MADPTSTPDITNITDVANTASGLLGNLIKVIQDIPSEIAKIPGAVAAAFNNTTQQPILDATTNATNATTAVGSFGDAILALPQQFLSANLSSIGDAFKSIGDEVRRLNSDLVALPEAASGISKMSEPFDRLSKSLLNYTALLKHTDMFDTFTATGSSAISTLDENFKGLQSGLAGLGIHVKLPGGAFLENASQAEKLQNAYIGLSAQAGGLNDIFKAGGTDLEDLSAITARFVGHINETADSTGLSNKEVLNFASGLKAIPGAMSGVIQGSDGANGVIDALTGTMRLMTGAGVSQTEVLNDLELAYEKLGQASGKVENSTQKGAEFLADVSSVANTLGLRFTDVKSVLTDVASKFEFIGNETDGASHALGRYVQALQETGLTGKASLEIVQNMTDSISKMTTGTKAFLSLRSGGPGGLQGAFQIDQLLRQGKLDQVLKMTEQSLKQQFGGRIFTQAEAAASPEAAAQFQRQRSLLQSGAFGVGKGLGDDQATRLLEALGKGDIGSATKDLKTGQDAVKQISERGTNLQQANNSELKILNRTSEKIAMASQLTALSLSKQFLGTGGDQRGAIVNQMNSANNKAYQASLEDKKAIGPETFEQSISMIGRSLAGSLLESTEGVAKGVVGVMGAEAKSTTDLLESLHAITKSGEQKNTIGLPPENDPRNRNIDNMPMSGDRERRQAILVHSVEATKVQQSEQSKHLHQTAATVVKAAQEKNGVADKQTPDKVIVELIAPPGMTVKVKEGSDQVDVIQRFNHNSMTPGSGI